MNTTEIYKKIFERLYTLKQKGYDVISLTIDDIVYLFSVNPDGGIAMVETDEPEGQLTYDDMLIYYMDDELTPYDVTFIQKVYQALFSLNYLSYLDTEGDIITYYDLVSLSQEVGYEKIAVVIDDNDDVLENQVGEDTPSNRSYCCMAPVSFLRPCEDCQEKGVECKLSSFGVCSNCGEINEPDNEGERNHEAYSTLDTEERNLIRLNKRFDDVSYFVISTNRDMILVQRLQQ